MAQVETKLSKAAEECNHLWLIIEEMAQVKVELYKTTVKRDPLMVQLQTYRANDTPLSGHPPSGFVNSFISQPSSSQSAEEQR